MATAANTSTQQFLTVFLGSQMFGIPVPHIQDVLGPQILTRVPLAPVSVEGILNLRGRIVTAINIRKRLNEKPAEGKQKNMSVVLEHEAELFSLLVDRVGDVLTIENKELEDVPVTLNPKWREVSSGVCQIKDKIMVIFDIKKILEINDGGIKSDRIN